MIGAQEILQHAVNHGGAACRFTHAVYDGREAIRSGGLEKVDLVEGLAESGPQLRGMAVTDQQPVGVDLIQAAVAPKS